jgi:hypothetical protein
MTGRNAAATVITPDALSKPCAMNAGEREFSGIEIDHCLRQPAIIKAVAKTMLILLPMEPQNAHRVVPALGTTIVLNHDISAVFFSSRACQGMEARCRTLAWRSKLLVQIC